MYFTIEHIKECLAALKRLNPFFGMSLLAFKRADIPVGHTAPIVFSRFADEILEQHYKPTDTYAGFFNPFLTSKTTATGWVQPRHSETSLQRITTNTFGDAIIHPKAQSEWGWARDYLQVLQRHLGDSRIPAFHLAVWLFRSKKWPSHTDAGVVQRHLFDEYKFTTEEVESLFNISNSATPLTLAPTPITERQLLELIGPPPGSRPAEGAALEHLEVYEVGPAKHFQYIPAERLNVITGDNSLGKTFILDCVWWALTGRWIRTAVTPRRNTPKRSPFIGFGITARDSKIQTFKVGYDWDRSRWQRPAKRKAHAGLVIYSRYDGSFGIWDPVRSALLDAETDGTPRGHLRFTRNQVWNGLQIGRSVRSESWVCNGLLRDWITWQSAKAKYEKHFERFEACLKGSLASQRASRTGSVISTTT